MADHVSRVHDVTSVLQRKTACQRAPNDRIAIIRLFETRPVAELRIEEPRPDSVCTNRIDVDPASCSQLHFKLSKFRIDKAYGTCRPANSERTAAA